MPVHRIALPEAAGGGVVLVSPRAGEAAAVWLRFDAGASEEAASEHGAAHLLEHMLFKGTARRGVGEAARDIEALGGDLNAFTSHDELVLHAEVAGGAWRDALDVIADLARDPTLDAAELERERPVVIEEIAGYADDPDDQLADAVNAALWGHHPYGRPVTGRADEVSRLQHAQLAALHRRAITPARATWIVVADADPDEVVAAVTGWTRDWTPGAPRGAAAVAPPAPTTPRLARPLGTFEDRAVELAWRVPGPGHPDFAPLTVLAAILGSAGDRITQALDAEPKAGFAGWAEVFTGLSGASLSLGFRPLPGRTPEALARTWTLLGRLGRSTGGRLCARAREMLLADLDFAEQTVDGVADDLLHHETLRAGAAHRGAWREAIAAVTPADIQRAVLAWLTPQTVVLGLLDPDLDDATARRHVPARIPGARAVVDGPERHTVGGAQVVLSAVATPVAAIRVLVPGGALRVTDRLAGLGAAWERTVHRGAGPYGGEALHDELEDLAASLDASEGYETLSLYATAPAAHLVDLVRLLGEVAVDPHLEAEEWALVREELIEDARTRGDRPRQLVVEEAHALRFKGHPFQLPPGGTPTTLARIDAKALQRFHDGQFVAGRPVVAVVGRMVADEVLDALSWLGDLPEAPRVPAPPTVPPLRPGVHEIRGGGRQAVVGLWGDGVGRDPARRGLEVATAVLEGQGGRMFLRLREEQGLAYDLWVRHEERTHGSLFHLGLACDPSRADAAAQALRDLLVELVEHPPTEAELSRARAWTAGAQALAAQRVESQASWLGYRTLYDLPLDPATHREQLAAVTAQDVATEIARVLDTGLLEVRCLPRDGA